MSSEASKPGQKGQVKGQSSSPAPAQKQPDPKATPMRVGPSASGPVKVPPLFRHWDWLAFALTTIVALAGYLYTISPQVTLEDSGELAVGSFYAGVPHPPGYPVWTIYTWVFTRLFPFWNVAWRVSLASAVAGALSCGLLSLLVSRGSSLIIEGIQELKGIDRKIEQWICLVAGFVAGMLMAFNGFMWSQAVIVEVYPFSVLSFMAVLCFLLRWVYAPLQRRYLYWASFMFGICFTNHQTLIVATMGLEVLILAISPRLGRDLFAANTLIYVIGLIAKTKGILTSFDQNGPLFFIYNIVGIGSALVCGAVVMKTQRLFTEWKAMIVIVLAFFAGAMFYFYMPIASMTNPPMNWGYPRTEEGFWHALTRGQYDKTNPTSDPKRFFEQMVMYVQAAVEEFDFVNLIIGLLPFFLYKRMLKRDRGWLVGLTAIYLGLSVLLLVLLNPSTDRQSREQARVFFAASHVIIAIAIGYGLAVLGGLIATQYKEVRFYILWSAAIAAAIALYARVSLKTQFPIDRFNSNFILLLSLAIVAVFWWHTEKSPWRLILPLFALMPLYSVLGHWSDNEQRGHYFGYYFGHDMFKPPYNVYPPMPKNTVLFGGTDPGRFNPTYMIFCESVIPPSKRTDPDFDRRDVYLITQNALADGTYLNYIRAHYNRSTENDPPFFVNFLRSQRAEELGHTNIFARMAVPLDTFFTKLGARIEKRRRMAGIYPKKDNPPPPPAEAENDPYDVGAYLSTEIYTPSPDDSARAFQEYIADAQRRLQHDMARPNEPKQIKPGEDVRIVENKISVSGQVAVMAINGILTRVIFDHNPTNDFYVEESFPLDWMYPYLAPYGIIMHINRNPLPEITEEMVKKDHEFWSKYSERLIGNWITYDTPVKQICDFIEKTYRRRDFAGYKGDKKFIRDDNAQKAFSKLRSAIGGLYFWRISNSKTVPENQRMIKEADFAFKQAFAYCPYSPEAVYKYVTLLANIGRVADAELVVDTCLKFDPENGAIQALGANIHEIKKGTSTAITPETQMTMAEQTFHSNPTNLQAAFQLASLYLQSQRSNEAIKLLEGLIAHTNVDAPTVLSVANAFSQLGYAPGLEKALQRLTQIMPENPESWYDLARAEAALNKVPSALNSLQQAIKLSDARLQTNNGAKNLAQDALTNQSFVALRNLPEFLKLISRPNRG
jgi:tetratricopeptide (TPR) repeat protein